MTQKSNKLKEYKSQFIEPYNFTISSNKHYIYRYFKNFKRLKAFLENGIFMSNGSKFDDGLECVDKETITKVKKLYNSLELWEEYNQHVTPAYLEGYKNNAQQNLMEISKRVKNEQMKYFISCWYLPDSEHENELMWKSYTESNDFGYLVKIKLEDFLDHLISSSHLNEDKVIYGIVKYFDYNSAENLQALKYKAFRKHNSYRDERELRLVIKNPNSFSDEGFFLKMIDSFYTDINIYMHPRASYKDYLNQRREILSKYKQELYLSDLSVAYNLKNF